MWTRKLLKDNAKVAFKRNYWACVAASVITALLCGGISLGGSNYSVSTETETMYSFETLMQMISQIPDYVWAAMIVGAFIGTTMAFAMSILVSNVAIVGCNRYFLENREHKTSVGQVFFAFHSGRYGHTVWIMFLQSLYIFFWTLLFIVPGIIKSFSYMMVPYILAENPSMDRKRVFKLSRQMMRGHKMEAFELGLSFFGWILLSLFTGGLLSIFYVNPYIYATRAEFYSALKADARRRGVLQEDELPGFSVPEE